MGREEGEKRASQSRQDLLGPSKRYVFHPCFMKFAQAGRLLLFGLSFFKVAWVGKQVFAVLVIEECLP